MEKHEIISFKGTQGFPRCLFKAVSLATLNKQMFSSLATHDALSFVHHKAQLHLVCSISVKIGATLIN